MLLILTQPLQPAQLVLESGGSDYLNECDWGGNDIGHLFGLPVEVEMLDASAACVFHLLLIFRWVKGAYTSPADGVPQGDTFDIDFVVHEIGHQLGYHTFRMSWKKLL
jgi:hypothetical protein